MQRFILLLFIFCTSICYSQPYEPILSDSTSWYVINDYFGYYTDFFFAADDTVMDNKSYKILDRFHYNRNAFLREDTAQRKFYYRHTSGFRANQDILIYDFAMQVGDSMLLYNPNSSMLDSVGYFTLDSIVNVQIKTGNRRAFHLTGPDDSTQAYWIEGIGSLYLSHTASGIGDPVKYLKLNCSFQNEVHTYESDIAASFNLCLINTVGIDENDSKEGFAVYPNPSNGHLNIDLLDSKGPISMKVFSFQGELIQSKLIRDGGIIKMNLSDQPAGMYFISIRSEGREFRQKIVLL